MIPDNQMVGKKMKISDFQTKDVINIIDGKRLGQISDLELDCGRAGLKRLWCQVTVNLWGCSAAGAI